MPDPLSAGQLRAVAQLHRRAFPGFFLTRLGPAFLRAYYRLILEDEGGIFLSLGDGENPRGFAAGFVNPERFYAGMRAARGRFLGPVILALLRRPVLIGRLMGRVLSVEAGQRRGGDETAELASLAVDPQARRHGAGRELVEAFCYQARARGARRVELSTDREGNEAVLGFYRGLGFHVREEFDDGSGRRMLRLVRALDP